MRKCLVEPRSGRARPLGLGSSTRHLGMVLKEGMIPLIAEKLSSPTSID